MNINPDTTEEVSYWITVSSVRELIQIIASKRVGDNTDTEEETKRSRIRIQPAETVIC